MKIIIISGRSGSGKSISLHLLEDLGFYCIDNLPASLIPNLLQHVRQHYDNIAIGIDSRNLPKGIDEFHNLIEGFQRNHIDFEIIYLDADEQTLLKRFNETRRKHPLTDKSMPLKEAIRYEKILLEPVAHLADLTIDTTHHSLQQLRDTISNRVGKKLHNLSLLVQSFGYKYGVPLDSDFIFDVRMLPNPYWYPELRPLTGLDKKIQQFLSKRKETQEIYQDIQTFLDNWIPKFENNNRNYITISIGCTGGIHRSVYIAKLLHETFNKQKRNVQIRHRELL